MKTSGAIRAAAGAVLCIVGFFLARSASYRQTTVIVDAGGCRLVTDVVDLGDDATEGSVVLLHGLAGNKKIMSYLARAFALENLRVFVPDLPGHGRTEGPFSFERASACTESFVRQLIARGAIDPPRTIVAGHSMGGAIAVLVAARVPVAGVIAVSPAPMTPAHGIPAFMLPFHDLPPTPAHTLTLSAAWEPVEIRETARDLIAGEARATGKYQTVPYATHVSLLFDSRVAEAAKEWAAEVLHLTPGAARPSAQMLAGSFAGFAGLLLLAGPFIHETLGVNLRQKSGSDGGTNRPASRDEISSSTASFGATVRLLLEVAVASLFAVVVLHFWNPFGQVIRIFEGDYLAGFLLILGVSLLTVHHRQISRALRVSVLSLLAAGFAAIVLHLLIIAWFDLTLSEAWFTAARWARFPALLAAALPYHVAEELLLGPMAARSAGMRRALALAFRLIAWGALLAGLFLLQSGAILLLLLAPYFALVCVLQRAGMDVVRKDTGSPLAAALFGAILLAGFCLVVFPLT
jgi:pimeloyl-ACP methyl ester carboxylesterase